jgi:hypothetical protein
MPESGRKNLPRFSKAEEIVFSPGMNLVPSSFLPRLSMAMPSPVKSRRRGGRTAPLDKGLVVGLEKIVIANWQVLLVTLQEGLVERARSPEEVAGLWARFQKARVLLAELLRIQQGRRWTDLIGHLKSLRSIMERLVSSIDHGISVGDSSGAMWLVWVLVHESCAKRAGRSFLPASWSLATSSACARAISSRRT